jgi:hypothetical protein
MFKKMMRSRMKRLYHVIDYIFDDGWTRRGYWLPALSSARSFRAGFELGEKAIPT